jgi:hypothetical protein
VLSGLVFTALIEKQLERKDLLAKELKSEKEKLRRMQNEVKMMQDELARQPSPFLLPKVSSGENNVLVTKHSLASCICLFDS